MSSFNFDPENFDVPKGNMILYFLKYYLLYFYKWFHSVHFNKWIGYRSITHYKSVKIIKICNRIQEIYMENLQGF